MDRLNRVEFYFQLAQLNAERSTCERGHVGAVAVQAHHVVAMGYNGALPGADHCLDVGCDLSLGNDVGCQRAIHAEANLVAWSARQGVALSGTEVYATHSPCLKCAHLLVAAGIGRYFFLNDYRLGRLDVLAEGGVVAAKYA